MLKTMTALTTAVATLATPAAFAQDTLVVAGFGWSFETLMREEVIPGFEAAHGVTIRYLAGDAAMNLERLAADDADQGPDVVILDTGPMHQADALGLCAPLRDAAIYQDLHDIARLGPNAVGLGLFAAGIAYDAERFAREGWDPPSSWADLTDPRFAGLLAVPSISNTYGLATLVMMARLRGGGEGDIDPGFAAMADEVGPNVRVFEPSSARVSALFRSGGIALAVWGSGRARSLAESGFPVAFAYPEEGAVALMLAGCPVAGGDRPDEANAFIEYLLQPEVQARLAEAEDLGPVNASVALTEAEAALLPYGPERIAGLVALYWDTINQLRQEWASRWAREVER